MNAISQRSGENYYPAILHPDGRIETLAGDPLVSSATAKKYAQIEIDCRNEWEREFCDKCGKMRDLSAGICQECWETTPYPYCDARGYVDD